MAGILLGSKVGALAMIIYTILGLGGATIFANFRGGLTMIFSPTFGFILSFIIIAFFCRQVN